MKDRYIDEADFVWSMILIFELFESIPSETESIIGDESNIEEYDNAFIEVI